VTATDYLVGLDLGQVKDYSAIAVLSRSQEQRETDRGVEWGPTTYQVGYLSRVRGVPYTEIVEKVQTLLQRREFRTVGEGWSAEPKSPTLVVDATGVGRPVVDMLRAAKLKPVAITITGGDTVGGSGMLTVPKRDLVSTVQVLLQGERIKVAAALKDQPLLTRELLNFQVRIDPLTTHDSYGAWREGAHDDLVLAVALACWYGERRPRSASHWPVIKA